MARRVLLGWVAGPAKLAWFGMDCGRTALRSDLSGIDLLPEGLNVFRIEDMSTEVREVQWSDLQRDPKGVAELADAGDVRVRRRDGANLLLIREDRVAAAGAGALTAARALRTLLAHLPAEKFVESLLEEFPWLRFLPVEEIREFCLDFVRGALAAAELGQWDVLEQVVREWKATAAIHADPALAEQLRRPINDDLGSVPSPMEES